VTTPTPNESSFEQRRNALARLLAASIMGLVKDPAGTKLPEDCWRQLVPKANAILFIVSTGNEHILAGTALERDFDAEHGYRGPG
jgi:hypothetical protein